MYITDSELLPDKYRELLASDRDLLVSGRPLNIWRLGGKDSHLYDCEEVIQMSFRPTLAVETEINPQSNREISPAFTGIFVVITGINYETGDEYRFGIKDSLNFCLQSLDSVLRTTCP